MKKFLTTIILIFLLSSCNFLSKKTENVEQKLSNNITYTDLGNSNIINTSNWISNFEKKDLNIQYELSQWICKIGYKEWTNNKYKFSICLPNNWKWVWTYWWEPIELFDEIQWIWKFNDKNNSISQIDIWNNNRLDIKDWYWYGITDTLITKIEWNKLYIDGFERLEWNNLVYKWSLLFINPWSNIISFFYNKNNKEHNAIISSVSSLN